MAASARPAFIRRCMGSLLQPFVHWEISHTVPLLAPPIRAASPRCRVAFPSGPLTDWRGRMEQRLPRSRLGWRRLWWRQVPSRSAMLASGRDRKDQRVLTAARPACRCLSISLFGSHRPPIITPAIFDVLPISCSGLPSSSTRSARFPTSIVPARRARPEMLGDGSCPGDQRLERCQPGRDVGRDLAVDREAGHVPRLRRVRAEQHADAAVVERLDQPAAHGDVAADDAPRSRPSRSSASPPPTGPLRPRRRIASRAISASRRRLPGRTSSRSGSASAPSRCLRLSSVRRAPACGTRRGARPG